ncbi:hypothetical protein B0H14DRAFT_3433199 [Mycena olivaceomarginata]|nr:hypothetical protein B0H14DRAFT_3433199 [Mycena olivaceomarginata]
MHKEDELHQFRPRRTNGHTAANHFQKGYEELEEVKTTKFIEQSTAYADVTADVLNPEEISDEDFQHALESLIAQVNEESANGNNLDEETDLEDGEGNGEDTIGGMEYSDNEGEGIPASNSEDGEVNEMSPAEDSEDNRADKEMSEVEEENIDEYVAAESEED